MRAFSEKKPAWPLSLELILKAPRRSDGRREGDWKTYVIVFLRHKGGADDLLCGNRLISVFLLRRRRKDVLIEFLVLHETIGEVDSAVVPHPLGIVRPQARARGTGDVTTDDKFYGERLALASNWLSRGRPPRKQERM